MQRKTAERRSFLSQKRHPRESANGGDVPATLVAEGEVDPIPGVGGSSPSEGGGLFCRLRRRGRVAAGRQPSGLPLSGASRLRRGDAIKTALQYLAYCRRLGLASRVFPRITVRGRWCRLERYSFFDFAGRIRRAGCPHPAAPSAGMDFPGRSRRAG